MQTKGVFVMKKFVIGFIVGAIIFSGLSVFALSRNGVFLTNENSNLYSVYFEEGGNGLGELTYDGIGGLRLTTLSGVSMYLTSDSDLTIKAKNNIYPYSTWDCQNAKFVNLTNGQSKYVTEEDVKNIIKEYLND
jgi:hypothetical protein